jgi:hypothetical protein
MCLIRNANVSAEDELKQQGLSEEALKVQRRRIAKA